MSMSARDKRALQVLAGAVALIAIVWIATSPSDSAGKAVISADSIPQIERRLEKLRASAATVPAKQAILRQVNTELAQREKGLIQADTAAQAQARLVQILREVARNQRPPVEIRQVELGPVRPYGDSYGIVTVSVSMECRTDELVNFMAFLSAQPELIATEEIRFGASHPKQKTVPVRMTINGAVPRRLVPEKKGTALF